MNHKIANSAIKWRKNRRKSGRLRKSRISQLEQLEVRRLLAREVAGVFGQDDTWSGTIRVTGDVRFDPGAKLTIAPGTVVKFDSGRSLDVRGLLNAIATASEPIVFTSSLDDSVGEDLTPGEVGVPLRGHWEALYLNNGDAGVNLAHAEVRYAGRTNGPTSGSFVAAVGLAKGTSALNDVLITDVASTGVYIAGSDPALDRVTVQRAGGVAFHQTIGANPSYSQLAASGTAGNRVQHDGGGIASDRTWDFGGLPVHLGGTIVIGASQAGPATLAIEPGTVVKFDKGDYLHANTGTLKALGTASEPIIFTATSDDTAGGDSNGDGTASAPYAGWWESLYLQGPSNVLEHVEVRYSGDTDGNGIGGGQTPSIQIYHAGTDPEVQTRLSNVRIKSGYSNAINVLSGNPTLENVHAESNLGAAYYFLLNTDPVVSGLTARDNRSDAIYIQGGGLSVDRTWDYGVLPIHPTGTIVIGASQAGPATLAIEPGTVVKFDKGDYLHANTGTLKALGTASEPIIFTATSDDTAGGDSNGDGAATTPYAGWWESLYLQGPSSVLEHVEVRYSGDTDGNGVGGGQTPSIQIYHAGTDPEVQTRLSNVRIKSGYSNAINVLSGNPTLENVHAESNLGAAYYFQLNTDPVVSGLTARDNRSDAIYIQGGNLTSDRVWDYGSLPIHLTGTTSVNASQASPTTLSIAAGTVVKFDKGDYLHANTGTLKALGTASEPIIFTATSDDTAGGDSNGDGTASAPYAGWWESLYLQGPSNVLEHVEVRYSGDTDGNGIGGGQTPSIQIYHAGTDPEVQTRLSNVRVRSGYSNAINVLSGKPTLENVHAEDNLGGAYYFQLNTAPVVSGLTARDNRSDAIYIQGGNLTSDRVWDYGSLPIHLTGTTSVNASQASPTTLTIAAGTVVKFDKGDYLHANTGTLKALGSASEPIIFTATSDDTAGGDSNGDGTASAPYAGWWESLYLDGPANVLENVEVRYVGDTDGNGVGGGQTYAIRVGADAAFTNVDIQSTYSGGIRIVSGATLTLTGGQFDNTSTSSTTQDAAIYVDRGSLVATNLDVIGGDYGIFLDSGESATVAGSTFAGLGLNAAQNQGNNPTLANFQNNWWGHPGGPHDPSNADGVSNDNPAGQSVSNFVDYGNWLTTPPARAIGPRVIELQRLSTGAPVGIHHRYEANGNALDTTGGRSGIFYGDVSYAAGRAGGLAFDLDGDGDYVGLGSWAPVRDWTVAAWVQPTVVPVTGSVGIAGSRAEFRDWAIEILDGNYVAVVKGQFVDSGVAASVGVWTHVAATLNGTNLQIYTDGVLRNSLDIGSQYIPSSAGVRIGSSTFNSGNFFTGLIDEVSIVERGISAAEIVQLKDSGTVAPAPSRLLVVFDRPVDGTSFTLADETLSGPATIAVARITALSDRSFELTLSGPLTTPGDYTLTLGPNVQSVGGIAMDQDADGVAGETTQDQFTGTVSVDRRGPRIAAHAPSGTINTVLSSIEVTFNEAVDPKSFTASDVRLWTPGDIAARDAFNPTEPQPGFRVRAAASTIAFQDLARAAQIIDAPNFQSRFKNESVRVINYGPIAGDFANDQLIPLDRPNVDDNYFVLEATATITIPAAGKYTFAVGSDDGFGLEIGGQSAEFAAGRNFAKTLAVFDFASAGTYPLKLLMFELTGSAGFELSAAPGEREAFGDDFVLVGDTAAGGLAVEHLPVAPEPSVQVLSVDSIQPNNRRYRITFPPQPFDGAYEIEILPTLSDASGNLMNQDNDANNGEFPQDRYVASVTVARDPLRVVSQTPVGSVTEAIEAIEVTFNVPIDPSSFSTADARLIGPSGEVAVTSIERLTDTRYRIRTARATADGNYQLLVGPDITDPAGIAMDSDSDAVVGELEDRYVGSLRLDGVGPQLQSMTPRSEVRGPIGFVDLTFSEALNLSTFTAVDVTIQGPEGSIAVTRIESIGGNVYRAHFASQTTPAEYTVSVGPFIADIGGTLMDQDQDGRPGEVADDIFTESFSIDAGGPRVVSVVPTGAIDQPFDFVDVTFSEAIDPASVTPSDARLTGPRGNINISQVVVMDSNVVRIRFPRQSEPGLYELELGPNVLDLVGNAMDNDGDGIDGEPEDKFTTTIAIELADLVITDISAPDTATNGQQITVTWMVRNENTKAATAPWTDRVVFSSDQFYGNSDDVLLGNLIVTSDFERRDATYTGTVTGTLPFGVTGEHRIFVVTDVGNTVRENDEVNNRSQRPITVDFARPPADLIVDAITVPTSIGIGAPATVTWRVRNDGTAATDQATWVDRVYLSSNNTLGGDVLLGTFEHNGVLAADASYTQTQTVVVPPSVSPGNYFILVQTDALNNLEEPGAEGNNVTASVRTPVTAQPLPDLVINSVNLAAGQIPTSGEPLTVNWVGSNVGSASVEEAWTDRVYLSKDATLSGDDLLWGEREHSSVLAVNATYNASVTAELPDGISGDYFFIVVPDALKNIAEGAGETTGTLASNAVPVQSFPYADLIVSSVTAPELLIGDPVDITVSWTVENVGAGAGRESTWMDRVVLSRDAIYGNGDDLQIGLFEHTGAMPTGTNYERSEIIQLPNRTSGRFTLFVHTDSTDAVYELAGHQVNHTAVAHPVNVTPTPYADLVVEAVTTAGTPLSGQAIDVIWTIANRGISTTNTSTWTDYIYISSDPTGNTGLRLIGSSVHGGALGIDQTYERTSPVVIPRDADGEHYLFVRTSGPYEFIYNDAGNTGRSAAIDVIYVPPPELDLRVTEVSLGGLTEAFDSTQVEVTWTVRNDGPETTETGWSDRLYLQSVDNPSDIREFGRFAVANPLEAGKTLTRTELVTLPRTSGVFRFVVEVDSLKKVVETDEVNNETASDNLLINLRPRPDLRVVDLTAPSEVTAGTIIDVQFTVANVGSADTPSGGSRWNDRVWLSSSANSLAGAILLGELQNQSALGYAGTETGQPNEYRSEASFLIPRALAGNWFVVVDTDARGQVDEYPSEGNNRAASAIAIDANPVPPPDLVVQQITGPGDVFDDSTLTVRYKVANLGAGETDPGSWSDQIWLTRGKDGPKPARGDRLIGSFAHSGVLQVGESYEVETTATIPKGLTGQYFLTVYADGWNRVYEAAFESNINPDAPNDIEGSNYGSTPINVLLTPPADLQVTKVTADASGIGDTQFTVSWEVTNNGTGQTDRDVWADAVYVSTDDVFDSSDQLVFAIPQPGPLAPGQSYEHSTTFTLPPSAAGSHIFVRTNVDPRIALTDEAKFLSEVRGVLTRIEEATGKPIGDVKVSDLKQFGYSELRDILAGPSNTLQTVYEGPYTDNNVGQTTTDIISADADFKVNRVTASPTSFSGEPITVSWEVENIGDFATSSETNSIDQFVFLSRDSVFDYSRAILAKRVPHVFSQPLAPNEKYTQSIEVATPPGSSGKWYAHVFVNVSLSRYGINFNAWDKSGFPFWVQSFATRQWENGAKLNNQGSSNEINVTYAEADLEISGLQAVPVDPNSGSLLDVRFTVTNNGNRTTRVDSWKDSVYLSTDLALDSYDIFLGSVSRSGELAPGESYEVVTQVRLPDNIGSTFYLAAVTDAFLGPQQWSRPLPYPIAEGPSRLFGSGSGAVLEFANEDDNLATFELDVQFVAAPDLVVDSVTAPTRLEVGQRLNVSYTVSNDGGAIPPTQVPYLDRIYLSRDTTLDVASDHYVGQIRRNEALGPGESETVNGQFWLPRGLVGDYHVFVVLDVPNASRPRGEVYETNEENNLGRTLTPLLIEVPPPSDVQVTDVSGPASAEVGDVVTVSWTVENRGDVPVRGRLADAVYLSADGVWDIGDRFVGRLDPEGGRNLQPGESYSASLDFEVPITLPGEYRLLVRTDIFDDVFEGENNRNNTGISTGTVNVTVPLLRLDIPLDDQVAAGSARLFQFDAEPGQTIRIDLDSINNIGSHELFVRFEDLPSPYQFDAKYEGYLRPDQSLVIPETQGGRYFVLARAGVRDEQHEDGTIPPRAEYPVQLNATRIPFGITGVTPDAGGDDRYVTMRVFGAEFPEQATVRLVRPQFAEFAPVSQRRIDATQMIAVFDLRDAPHGLYDVQVLHPDGRVAVDPYRFQVESADPLEVNVGIGGPSLIGLGETGNYGIPVQSLANIDTPYTIIEYAVPNVENDAGIIPGPAITMQTGIRGDAGTIAPLFDSVSTFDFADVAPELNFRGALTGRSIAIDLPALSTTELSMAVTVYPELRELLEQQPDFISTLRPDELEALSFDFYVVAAATPLSTAQYIDYQLAEAANLRTAILADNNAAAGLRGIAGDTEQFNGLYLQGLTDLGLLRPEDMPPFADDQADHVAAFFVAVGGLLGGDAGQGIVSEAAQSFATAGQTLGQLMEQLRVYYGHTADVNSGGAVADFANYDLGAANRTSFVTFTMRAGFPSEFDLGEVPDTVIFNTGGLGTHADAGVVIDGPDGFGELNMVPKATPLPYSIALTHDAEADSPAREIRIIVPMDDTLDERSFQLSDINLAGTVISIPGGRPSFVGEFDLFESNGYVLQVTAGVDAVTRNALWLLRAVDPRDGLPPRDPTIGLLRAGEQVEVGFWVEAETVAAAGTGGDVQTGDAIELTARTIIDEGEPRDSFINGATLDAVAPTSSWTVTALGSDRYQIDWSAEDDVGGSGTQTYSLLVSTDGGNRYRTVLYHTQDTSYVYRSEAATLPVFLVRAIDAAGNVEAAPAGVRVPRLTAPINLGSPPAAPLVQAVDLPTAVAAPSSVAQRLFEEAALGVPSRTSATQPSMFTRVIRPLAAERFANLSGVSGAGIGSLALAISPDDKWLYASGGEGRNELTRFSLTGASSTSEQLTALEAPVYELVFDEAGQLWATTGGEGLLQLDPNTGAVVDSFGTGIALGIANVPGETALYVATAGGVIKFNTALRTFESFSEIRVDSLAVADDGTLYGTQWPSGGRVLRFDFRGRATVVSDITDAESIAFGARDTLLEGVLIIGHQNSGQVSLLDPMSLQRTIIAAGGVGRVEGIESLPDGRLMVTQGEQIDVLFTVAAPRVIETRILDGNNRASIAFDVSLLADDPTNVASAINPDNYTLVNTETGEQMAIGGIRYDAANRTANLLFETLAPAPYRLTISPKVQSEQGIELGGEGESVDFRVFENVTAVMPVQFRNTRINRHDGTVLVDVQVTNNGGFDVAGPIQIVFSQLTGENVSVMMDGLAATDPVIQILPVGVPLPVGGTTTFQAVVVANPNLLDLDFTPTVRAALPANQLPLFLSSPRLSASEGEVYDYAADASDPDGSTVTYVLGKAPEGATVNATTGALTWTPGRWTEPRVEFELRAYDARGAYKRQTWTVDVSGANRAPIISPIGDQLLTEGDLLEVPVSAFDPDGDALFYFADNLPPGAVFDPYSQALRWRPGGDAAGAYENVTLIVSDGYFETKATFEIVVTNNNTPPTLAPVNDLSLREGDAVSFRLFGSDEDGDRLRYLSPNLPPGAFLDPNTGLFEWTPGYDQHGEFKIDFYADDGTGTTIQSATLSVENLNGQVAFAALTPFEIFEGQTITLRIAATDPEYPGATNDPTAVSEDFFVDQGLLIAPLDYSHAALPTGASYDPETQLFTWTPSFDQSGQYDLVFSVADDGDGTGTPTTDSVTLSLNILDANGRPEIAEFENQTLAVGETLQIPITATDPEGGLLALSVQIGQSTALPSWASFTDNGDGTGLLSLSPLPGNRDDYLVTVTAMETTGPKPLKETSQFILQVTSENEPPRFTPLFSRVVLADQALSFQIRVTDLDQDALTISASGLPNGATITQSSIYGEATLNWSPTAADIGEHTITFNVTDSGNGDAARALSDSRTIKLNVRATNARPSLEPIGAQTVAEGDTLSLQMQATDADGDAIYYTAGLVTGTTAGNLPRGADFDAATGTLGWTPDFTQSGTYRIRMTATDGAGSRSEDVLVTVTQTNQAPEFSSLPKLYGREGDTLFFAIGASDADGQPLVYRLDGVGGDWTGEDLPDGLRFDATQRALEWQAGYDVTGDYVLNFSVTDPEGGVDTLAVNVRDSAHQSCSAIDNAFAAMRRLARSWQSKYWQKIQTVTQ
ncbi:MAG: CARDB domain-containing protein [Pirellulaceae bacterium]